ncbi:hypothetical protein C4573_05455 [Candidatus Woesearchaeota archaeon]|nr:MAG: hypothetical protein C4573_05455 [Candidatus Woesearchaeota archaeon]
MDIQRMFIILVTMVAIVLMLITSNVMQYLYALIYVFLLVILLFLSLRTKRVHLRDYYLLLCTIVGFLFLVLYLIEAEFAFAIGYLVMAAYFIALILFWRVPWRTARAHKVKIVDMADLEKPEEPGKNIFAEMEKPVDTAEIVRQAKALEKADKQIREIMALAKKKKKAKRRT